jgi:acetyl-CoA carboxylase biotin carboxyl carrier protein
MKLNEIQDLIKFVAKSGVSEVELETKDIKIVIKTPASAKNGKQDTMVQSVIPAAPVSQPTFQPVQQAAPVSAPAAETKSPETKATGGADESKYITIKSPMIGTFYRAAGPDKPLFASVGDEIKPGKVLCIIEAMKLFNEIESDVAGRIVKVLVNDAQPVEYDQPLFLVEPM